MPPFLYPLPTTAAVAFAALLADPDGSAHASHIADATQARADLRALLKHARRTRHGDHLRIIKRLDDYIPRLRGIIAAVHARELVLTSEPVFSWRTTLSATLFNSAPRLRLPSLQADLASTLLTYAMALSNLAHSVTASLGTYELDPALTEPQRKDKDDKLNFAITLLCRASGVFSAISETVLPGLRTPVSSRPPDLSSEVNAALAKLALADAQALAIRKLLSRAASEIALSPGPPLPRSHPSTALLAKLHLDCAALYSSARSLAMAPSKSSLGPGLKASLASAAKSRTDPASISAEVSADLLKYLDKESRFHAAIAHKWLGVDAGETSRAGKGGEAVGFLTWAQQELGDLHTSRLSKGLAIARHGSKDQEQDNNPRDANNARIEIELKSVKTFLDHYRKINNSLTFDPVPKQSELQTRIPEGRMAVTARAYSLPDPAFGPGSKGYQARTHSDTVLDMERLRIDDGQVDNSLIDDDSSEDGDTANRAPATTGTYVGAGSYF